MKGLILLLLALMGGPPTVGLSVSPQVVNHPASINAKITIKPSEANRQACIDWESEDGEASQHCFPLDGAKAPTTTFFTIKIGSPGDYIVCVYLVRLTDIVKSTPLTISVQ